jgi:hypothetical protein
MKTINLTSNHSGQIIKILINYDEITNDIIDYRVQGDARRAARITNIGTDRVMSFERPNRHTKRTYTPEVGDKIKFNRHGEPYADLQIVYNVQG